jgi:hypothetical protein
MGPDKHYVHGHWYQSPCGTLGEGEKSVHGRRGFSCTVKGFSRGVFALPGLPTVVATADIDIESKCYEGGVY